VSYPEEKPAINLPDHWKDCVPTLLKWHEDLTHRASSHRRASGRLRTLNRVLGGLNVILAAIAATAMFAALNRKLENLPLGWQLLLTLVAVAPAIASGLQREWNTASREGLNVNLAVDCRKLVAELDYLLAFPPEDFQTAIREWHQRYVEMTFRSFYPRIRND
jgi:hypothetical protein